MYLRGLRKGRGYGSFFLLMFGLGLSIPIILFCSALVAMMQKDMKSLVAYSSVSHLGFVMLGVFAATPVSLQGGILQMINHGISTGMLFLIVGIIYERRHTREIKDYGGLAHAMPVYAIVFAFAMLSSAGLPLLNGFVGEFTILQGAFETSRAWAAFAVFGSIVLDVQLRVGQLSVQLLSTARCSRPGSRSRCPSACPCRR
jgi:NADH-quinone oxidoreductase subunit M